MNGSCPVALVKPRAKNRVQIQNTIKPKPQLRISRRAVSVINDVVEPAPNQRGFLGATF